MPSILFDESHGELLCSQNVHDDSEMDTWARLRQELERLKFNVAPPHTDKDKPLTEVLAEHDVLVLGAPTVPQLSLSEVSAIRDFVESGKSLLVAINSEALWLQTTNWLNELLHGFGLHAERLLNYPPEEITDLSPHYLTNGIKRLGVKEPAYFDRTSESTYSVARLPDTEYTAVAAGEFGTGRVVALGDFVLLGDRRITDRDNLAFVSNLFRWLTFANSIDCYDARVEPEIHLGGGAAFSITLSNPHSTSLERLHCTLESDAGAQIAEPIQSIRYLPAHGQVWLSWLIEPQRLGAQSLRLTIDFPKKSGYLPLSFESVARFMCEPDAKIDLAFAAPYNVLESEVETEKPFEVQAQIVWGPQAKQVPLEFRLDVPLAHLVVDPVDNAEPSRWRITALDTGEYSIKLTLPQTGQSVSSLIRARPSAQMRIAGIERDVVAPLSDEIRREVRQIRDEFTAVAVEQISFEIVTPEDYLRRLFPGDTADHLLKSLSAARLERNANRPLIELLLRSIAPIFSPSQGCLIPYDPELARNLARENSMSEESLAHNFLSLAGYDSIWLEQNVAAFLLHEKYGHGFFFSQTALGKQLAILYRHGLIRSVDYKRLRAPYPQRLQQEYSKAIRALDDSAIIVNEGFAAWVEITVLPRLKGPVGQVAYRRRSFLFERDAQMQQLAENANEHPYFQRYPPFRRSRYQEGFEYLELIQGYFGQEWGPKCAVQAIIKAADIDLGIIENNGHMQFGLSAKAMTDALLADDNDDARADMRLRRIHLALRKERDKIRIEQKRLQCHRVCLHAECPVNAVIKSNLNW